MRNVTIDIVIRENETSGPSEFKDEKLITKAIRIFAHTVSVNHVSAWEPT